MKSLHIMGCQKKYEYIFKLSISQVVININLRVNAKDLIYHTTSMFYILLKYYCSGQVNWDASKLLTQKNMYPELGHRMLIQKDFGTT